MRIRVFCALILALGAASGFAGAEDLPLIPIPGLDTSGTHPSAPHRQRTTHPQPLAEPPAPPPQDSAFASPVLVPGVLTQPVPAGNVPLPEPEGTLDKELQEIIPLPNARALPTFEPELSPSSFAEDPLPIDDEDLLPLPRPTSAAPVPAASPASPPSPAAGTVRRGGAIRDWTGESLGEAPAAPTPDTAPPVPPLPVPPHLPEGSAAATATAAPAAAAPNRVHVPAPTPVPVSRVGNVDQAVTDDMPALPQNNAPAEARVAAPSTPPAPPAPARPQAVSRATPATPQRAFAPMRDDRAVAALGSRVVTQAELYEALKVRHGRSILRQMLNRILMEEELVRRNLVILPEEVQAVWEKHLERFAQAARRPVDPVTFLPFHFGLTPEEYRSEVIWPELALGKLVSASFSVSDSDLFNFYYSRRDAYSRPETVRAQHILIDPLQLRPPGSANGPASSRDWSLAHQKALELQRRLQTGAEFASLARQESHDRTSAERGGDLGHFQRGVMAKPFEDAAFAMAVNETSDPVKTIFGYHLIQVLEKREGRLKPFNEVRDQVHEDYVRYLTMAQSEDLLTRLRQEALRDGRLQIFDPDFAPQSPESADAK